MKRSLLVDYLIPKNFKFCRQVPNSGYRGFLGRGIGILMEASSPRAGTISKWPIFKMVARRDLKCHIQRQTNGENGFTRVFDDADFIFDHLELIL